MFRDKPKEPPSFSTQEELETLLLEGLESGEPIPVTPQFWRDLELELEYRQNSRRKAS
ncbi:hypothetical protein AciX8_3682 [Granulicella mallensis MP5ACTX8]|uniref:Uncharacterized protein n=1 Tax=Granulicella mallensis (strain ATCC BAA-1857 / DSM 23137 / MP5ACTX8) TaxID=682795 RepID=G8NZE2_GRAMM|nr:hypothetical protein AciX8_3682 [Granulicella mallensis MP5ACTX8]